MWEVTHPGPGPKLRPRGYTTVIVLTSFWVPRS